MANLGVIVGWKRALPGREAHTVQRFGDYVTYMSKLVAEKQIDSFEPVIVRPHGGDLNGFFLVRSDAARLAALRETDEWKDWEVWGAYNLDGFGVVECSLGDGVGDVMGRFSKVIQS